MFLDYEDDNDERTAGVTELTTLTLRAADADSTVRATVVLKMLDTPVSPITVTPTTLPANYVRFGGRRHVIDLPPLRYNGLSTDQIRQHLQLGKRSRHRRWPMSAWTTSMEQLFISRGRAELAPTCR